MRPEPANLHKIFTYHAPVGDQVDRYQSIREMGEKLASVICIDCPASEERTLALRKVQEAVMWANASIAINEENR